jgi:hypothetical protein
MEPYHLDFLDILEQPIGWDSSKLLRVSMIVVFDTRLFVEVRFLEKLRIESSKIYIQLGQRVQKDTY